MRPAPQIQRRLTSGPDDRIISAIGPDDARFPVEKLKAHREGLLHDAVSVFVFDGAETLLQRRAAAKYHCAGLWANACCTHPDWGEDAGASARRRLIEELGLDLELTEIALTTYRADVGGGLVEHERVRMFRADVDRRALSFDLDPLEVSEVRWVTREALTREIAATPQIFAPWLRIYLQRWDALGLTR
ncbi:MAG: NUDIX domain-containing protein [Oceanicaulis sp.]|nr:NUDIX domain-containing protein [Oceanicaulis sp.]